MWCWVLPTKGARIHRKMGWLPQGIVCNVMACQWFNIVIRDVTVSTLYKPLNSFQVICMALVGQWLEKASQLQNSPIFWTTYSISQRHGDELAFWWDHTFSLARLLIAATLRLIENTMKKQHIKKTIRSHCLIQDNGTATVKSRLTVDGGQICASNVLFFLFHF